MSEWLTADSEAASAEGWDVFESSETSGAVETQIQRVDFPKEGDPAFLDDAAAWRHVVDRARAGSSLHQRALQAVCPAERAKIAAQCGPLPGGGS